MLESVVLGDDPRGRVARKAGGAGGASDGGGGGGGGFGDVLPEARRLFDFVKFDWG